MTNLFAEITPRVMVIFFVFGTVSGSIYFFTARFLSALLIENENNILKNGSQGVLPLLRRKRKGSKFSVIICDTMCAVFILTLGVYLVLINYALIDGMVRIHTIVSLLLGIYLSKNVVSSTMFSVIINIIRGALRFIIRALLYPIRLVYCTITKKESKNYSIPTI